jgi:hypothetical protein
MYDHPTRQEGVAIRSGHHCTQPLHRLLGAKGSARASLYIYNTFEEVRARVCVRVHVCLWQDKREGPLPRVLHGSHSVHPPVRTSSH